MRRLSVLFPVLLLGGCGSAGGPLIRVVNADSVTLDRVMVDAGGSSYALGRLLPGTAGQIRPAPAPDSMIQLRHATGGPFTVTAAFDDAAAVFEIRLVADSVAGVRVEPR